MKRRVGSRVGSFENAARSRVDRPIRGSTLTARPTANKYREGKLKRTLKRESKRTRNRPKEKKPRGRAGVRLGRSIEGPRRTCCGAPTVVDRCRRRPRPIRLHGSEVAPPRTRRLSPGGCRRRGLQNSRPGLGRKRDSFLCPRLIRLRPWRPVLKHGPRSLTHAQAKRTNVKSLDAKRRRANEKPPEEKGVPDRKWGREQGLRLRQSAALTEVHLQGPERW